VKLLKKDAAAAKKSREPVTVISLRGKSSFFFKLECSVLGDIHVAPGARLRLKAAVDDVRRSPIHN
jgi:hypothetical protein